MLNNSVITTFQEIGLFIEFTMKETFVFYGRMFGLNFKAVKTKCKELAKVLDLPDWRHRIGGLRLVLISKGRVTVILL